MRILIKSLAILFFLINNALADIESISEKMNEFMSNIVPGEGITETSLLLSKNHSPYFSILATR